jgi:hypothetical protein
MGRSSLIMVAGFSMVLMLMGYRLSNVSTAAYENYLDYYNRTTSHNLAAGFANMGSQVIYRTPNNRPVWTNRSLGGGTVSLWTDTLAQGRVQLTSTSDYNGYQDTVIIVWGQSKFSKFAYYSVYEKMGSGTRIYWATKDTIYGPFHTQDQISVDGNPVFWGKATTKKGLYKNPSSSKPKFLGGYQSGIDIQMPSDFDPLKNAALSGGKYISGKDSVAITFNSNGTVTVKEGADPAYTVPVSTFAPNGAVVIDGANVRVKGKFTGQLTLAVQSGGVSGKGNMYLDSSITYVNDPLSGPSSDMLGLCAENDIIIKNNWNNSAANNGISIQAAMFSQKKGLTAEDYDNGKLRGAIRLLGGISQNQRGAVGLVGTSGYTKSYRYDERMMNQSPPYYPTTGSYEILSWYER